MENALDQIATAILALAIFLGIYFLPFWIANGRKHRNQLAIFMANLFLGWTFIGWVVSLIWACTNQTQTIVVKEILVDKHPHGQSLS